MALHDVTVFAPYEFSVGEKIRIDGGPRHGDWEVIAVTDKKVRLRCPTSGAEVEWARFSYNVQKLEGATWPDQE